MPKSSEKGTTAVVDTSARRSHAIPPVHEKHKHSVKPPPFCPAERASVLLNHILCLLVSKMSNLSPHNSLPHRSISVTRSHKRRRLNVSTSRQRGVTDLRYATRGVLFTCPHSDDDPQIWPRTTLCFWPFCNRLLPRKDPPSPQFT